ncbi:MAG: cation diffusion facilitator family transporter [Actinobacteria bacterium]|nr:cation diffusion facilitator family transporter [Actinomycetota bacterium]
MAKQPSAVIAAFFANLGIGAAKFTAFALTGSSSMLAESFHSVADTGNQALLLLGHRRAQRRATPEHPFGYARERYFWAFVVAMILFALGAVFSLWEGYSKLRSPHPIESPMWAFAVLGIALVAESVALRIAVRTANESRTGSWWHYIRTTKDAGNAVVLLEDAAAETGLVVALLGVGLSVVTGDARWDAMGSLAIGALLAFVSMLLAVEMRSLLIGEAASPADYGRVRRAIEDESALVSIIELRTMHLGPSELMVAAKVQLRSDLDFDAVARTVNAMEARVREAVPTAAHIFVEPARARSATGG